MARQFHHDDRVQFILVLNRHSRQGTYIQGPAVSKSDGEISWEVHLSKVAAGPPGRAEHRRAIAPPAL